MNLPIENEFGTSKEEKFFGVTTPVTIPVESEAADGDAGTIVTIADTDPVIATQTVNDDDADGELVRYSEKVQKRFDKLTWRAKEAERQRLQAEALREEAVRYAQQVNQTVQQQANLIATGEERLVNTIKSRADLAVQAARQAYVKSHEEGNTEEILKAQENLTLAQAEQLEAFRYGQDFEQRKKQQQWQQQQRQALLQQPRPPVQQQKPQLTQDQQEWAQANTWFMKDEEMTALAFGVHERLKKEGVPVGSKHYYDTINAAVRHRFPEYNFGDGGNRPNNQAQRPSMVVAPSSRNTGGKPRQVTLTESQVQLAKKLGLTPQQYAAQALREQQNG